MTTDTPAPATAAERTGLLDSPPEERFDRITRLARELFDVDYALVNIVDADEIYTKSQPEGPRFGRSPLEAVFCGETVKQDGLLEVDDATADERFRDIAAVTEYGMRFYAGFPCAPTTGRPSARSASSTPTRAPSTPRSAPRSNSSDAGRRPRCARATTRVTPQRPVPPRRATAWTAPRA